MKLKGLLVGLVLAIAFAFSAAGGCGKKEESKNPASSALDSLPNANLNAQTAEQATQQASNAASSATEVPTTADFTSVDAISPSALKALSQKNLSYIAPQALGSLKPQQVEWIVLLAFLGGCDTVTNTSDYPTGTTINILYDAGPGGCTVTTGVTLLGSWSLIGEVDYNAGTVDVTLTFNKRGFSADCETSGSGALTFNGSLTFTATGLTSSSSYFSLSEKGNVNVSFSATNCDGHSGSASGFIYADKSISGTKSGNVWTVNGSDTEGIEVVSGFSKIGVYAEWKGTISIDTKGTDSGWDDTGTISLTGRVGWNYPMNRGKVNIKVDVGFDHNQCWGEPISGTLEISSGNNKAVVNYDGNTNGCGCAPWTLNGVQQIDNVCW